MFPLRFFPDDANFGFVRRRFIAYGFTALLFAATLASLFVQGLNFGIDFKGGIAIEVAAAEPIDLATLRSTLNRAGIGEIEVQNFGNPRIALIRAQVASGAETAASEAAESTIRRIRTALGQAYDFRRVEAVGPRVGNQFLIDGLVATVLALALIGVYVAFRFEWQFGVAAIAATMHDTFVTVGVYSLSGYEFNLTSIAAMLTIAGYSINDTVVVFDRIRENMRKFKRASLPDLIDKSVNQTLSRTVLTSGTTLLAIIPLLLFGGSNLQGFTVAVFAGILVGTYSSIFVAAPLLLMLKPVRVATTPEAPEGDSGEQDREAA